MKTYMPRYKIIRELIEDEELGSFESYGILAVDSADKEIFRISDISTDAASLSDLIEQCNRGGVSLLHIHDIVEDFLS